LPYNPCRTAPVGRDAPARRVGNMAQPVYGTRRPLPYPAAPVGRDAPARRVGNMAQPVYGTAVTWHDRFRNP